MLKAAVCQPCLHMLPRIMELLQLSQCDKSFQFECSREWPEALPVISWMGVQLNGLQRDQGFALNLQGDLISAIKAAYPALSFCEIAQLKEAIDNSSIKDVDSAELFAAYEYRYDPAIESLLEPLKQCPKIFIDWCIEKGVGPKELSVLRAIDDLPAYSSLLQKIVEVGANRNQGAQLIEWGCELQLAGEPVPEFTGAVDTWLKEIKKQRFPHTSVADHTSESKMKKLPWPLKSKVQWQRLGDKAGVSFQAHLSNHEEFEKQLIGLQKVASLLKEDPSRLWKN